MQQTQNRHDEQMMRAAPVDSRQCKRGDEPNRTRLALRKSPERVAWKSLMNLRRRSTAKASASSLGERVRGRLGAKSTLKTVVEGQVLDVQRK